MDVVSQVIANLLFRTPCIFTMSWSQMVEVVGPVVAAVDVVEAADVGKSIRGSQSGLMLPSVLALPQQH